MEPHFWYQDPVALRLIAKRYLPWLAALNLAWEVLHLPLYTIWEDSSAARIAFAVVHCTAGDVLIGLCVLVIALVVTRAGQASTWRLPLLALIVAGIGVAYTAWSEWMNTVLRPAWTYSPRMPTLTLSGIELGLSPLLQWLVVPPAALRLARRLSWR